MSTACGQFARRPEAWQPLDHTMAYVLADVVSESVVDRPIEELDLAYWVYAMSDRDYRNCARGHYGCGSSPLPGGARSSINAECVGGHFLVQHYEPEVLEPHHVRMVSPASDMWIFRLIPSRVKVIWDISLEPQGDGRCLFRDHIRVEHKSALLWLLAKFALINWLVQRHDDEETPLFAANCVDLCQRRKNTSPV